MVLNSILKKLKHFYKIILTYLSYESNSKQTLKPLKLNFVFILLLLFTITL